MYHKSLTRFKKLAGMKLTEAEQFGLAEDSWDKFGGGGDEEYTTDTNPMILKYRKMAAEKKAREQEAAGAAVPEGDMEEDYLKVRGYDAVPPPEAREPPQIHGMDHTDAECCPHGQMPGECDDCCPHGMESHAECPDCGAELEITISAEPDMSGPKDDGSIATRDAKLDHTGLPPDEMGGDEMVKIADGEFYTPYFEGLEESMEEDYDMNYPLLNKKVDIVGYDFKGRGDFPAHYVPSNSADNPMKDIIDYGKSKAITEGLTARYERFKEQAKRV